MGGTRRGCDESLAKGVEIVSKVGDDIRIHFEDSGSCGTIV